MKPSFSNPYARNTPEHRLWARWHRAFFDQPLHSQVLSVESQLRQTLSGLLQLSCKMEDSPLRSEVRTRLLEIEDAVDLLDEVAEHAYVQVIATPADRSERSN